MKNWLKYSLLSFYCILGIAGWYQYATLSEQREHVYVKKYDQLSPELTVSYVRAIVWYHSRGKLQELRSILMEENLEQQDRVKVKVINMLKHRTSSYIRDLNTLDTPVHNLGNWYQDNFDFDNFLNAVFEIVFNEHYAVDEKIKYITDVMEEYQNMTTYKLIITMKEKEKFI